MRKFLIPILAVALGLLLVPGSALAQGARVHAACSAIDLQQGTPSDPTCDSAPSFKASFLNRVWRFDGSEDSVDLDQHTLDMTLSGIENLPARFNSQDDPLLDQDTRVRFNDHVRVYGPDGVRVTQDYLPYAEDVVVRGKLVAPAKWSTDEEGNLVPTIRAKRIYITQYVQDTSDANDSSSNDQSSGVQSANDQSSGDQSSNDQSSGDQSSGDQSSGDQSSSDPTPGDGVVSSSDVEIWIHIYIHLGKRA
jgi:hypothetical protein